MLSDKISYHLNEMELSFEYNQEQNRHSYFFDLDISNGLIRAVIGLNEIDEFVLIYLMCPNPLPQNKKAEVLEYISRINFDDMFGAFVYDFEDNLVGYHSVFFIEEDMPCFDKHFMAYLKSSIEKIDFYLPGLFHVAFGDKDPALVINELEFETDPRLN